MVYDKLNSYCKLVQNIQMVLFGNTSGEKCYSDSLTLRFEIMKIQEVDQSTNPLKQNHTKAGNYFMGRTKGIELFRE